MGPYSLRPPRHGYLASMEPKDIGALQPLPTSADREAIIARLTDAYANDVLDLDEFERRASAAYAERSPQALAVLTADLPEPAPGRAPHGAVTPADEGMHDISAFLASVERSGMTSVPRRLTVRATIGSVELDLSRATFLPGVTEIVVRALIGSIEIYLPPDVMVENHGGAIIGSFECEAHAPDPGAARPVSTVRITGRAIIGSVEID